MQTVNTTETHIIDLDADPRILYDGWKVEEHRKGGQLAWDPAKISLYLSEKQQNGSSINGDDLRKVLADKPVFNANLLDYLHGHQHLIPEEWKDKGILFWGTIYRNADGNLFVRHLFFDCGHWQRGYDWLGRDWRAGYPVAVAEE